MVHQDAITNSFFSKQQFSGSFWGALFAKQFNLGESNLDQFEGFLEHMPEQPNMKLIKYQNKKN